MFHFAYGCATSLVNLDFIVTKIAVSFLGWGTAVIDASVDRLTWKEEAMDFQLIQYVPLRAKTPEGPKYVCCLVLWPGAEPSFSNPYVPVDMIASGM